MRTICSAVVLALTVASNLPAAPGDEYWDDRFYLKGLSGDVSCVAIDPRGDLYVGGLVEAADGELINHVATWDGIAWHTLGKGLNGQVTSLAVASSGHLIAGGGFNDAGGDPDADHVAVWNGSAWTSLGGPGSGLDALVHDLSFDATGRLFAGGFFADAGGDPDADHIAVWDGSGWSSVGGAGSGVNSAVYAVAISTAGDLVIGGAFTDAGGDADADHIAGWNGSAWVGLGRGLNSFVFDVAFAADGDLYAGGLFTDAGGDPDADRIARWSRLAWTSVGGVGSGLEDAVQSIVVTGSGDIVAGGKFVDAGGDDDADRIARLSPQGWVSVGGPGSGLNDTVWALTVADGGALIAAGRFRNAGANPDADAVAVWDRDRWAAMTAHSLPAGSGLDHAVASLAPDGNGRLYAGGHFQNAGNLGAADYFAVWDGSAWSAVGGPTAAFSAPVFAILPNHGGRLVVGGSFQDAGGDPDADSIAAWDGTAWSSLGPGSGLQGIVSVLVEGADGLLYAGGSFNDAGGDPAADFVAVWDGVSWSAIAGSDGGLNGQVQALVFDDDRNLYAGGDFSQAGRDLAAEHVAVWDGVNWASLGGAGSGLDDWVFAIALDRLGRVVVGGQFEDAGGHQDADAVAVWDGIGWSALGTGLNLSVRDLVWDGAGNLYAAGLFAPTLDAPSHPRHVAVWDGSTWKALGSGLDTFALALAYDGGRKLYVGGSFEVAGDTPSSRLGCWKGAMPEGMIFADGFESGGLYAWSAATD